MNHMLDRSGTPEGLDSAISECMEAYSPKALMVLSGSENDFTPETIDSVLHKVDVPIIGGIFPGILHDHNLYQRGSLVICLPCRPRIQVVTGLNEENRDFDDSLDADILGENGKTMFVFVDGLAQQVDSLVVSLFCRFGMAVNYIGGGAGKLQPESTPCLITNEGLIRNAAVLAVIDAVSGVGISHGMKTVSSPHVVSDISTNAIGSIDWEPARKRFQELIGQVDPSLVEKKNFPVSNEFCLAISRIGEKVIRDPYKAGPNGELHVVSTLREGSYVDIVQATPGSTVQSAETAMNRAKNAYQGDAEYGYLLCFDCFTRWQYLGENFNEEIEALQDNKHTLLGALTLGGEIANCGQDFLDYYNRTCVVGILEDKPCNP